MNRRQFVGLGAGAVLAAPSFVRNAARGADWQANSSVHTTVDVVGDGKWVWTKPPAEKRGLLEPRSFDLKVVISMQGTGGAVNIKSTTIVPVELPEQKIESANVQTQGCVATLRQIAPACGQLILAAPSIVQGQVIRAVAHFRLTMLKQYFGYKKEQFPAEQTFDKTFSKAYLYDDPGITTRIRSVRDLAHKIGDEHGHPFDKARAFKHWVRKHIKMRPGRYTSVVAAIRDAIGDCEERASVFAAFCRICGIPTRSVWAPNHVWAEFVLKDHDGVGHWIPAHTSAYTWFGYTGVHELVLQKGDEIRIPEQKQPVRFAHDWVQWKGAKPRVQYTGVLTPIPNQAGADPGPGGWIKTPKPQWVPGEHELDKFLRDGELTEKSPFKNNEVVDE